MSRAENSAAVAAAGSDAEPTVEPAILAVPMKLDVFILNADVCGGDSTDPDNDGNADCAKIAPLSQPNYTLLRFEASRIQNDTLAFTDLHRTGPAPFNRRFTDLGTHKDYSKRQGVYIHWIVPRAYRIGSTMSGAPSSSTAQNSPPSDGNDDNDDDPSPQVDQGDTAAPDFRPAPTRCMVIRKTEACDPPNALPEIDAWVVESNRQTCLDSIPLTDDVDIQVDYAPYVAGTSDPQQLSEDEIAAQAEVFIGYKEGAKRWKETEKDPAVPGAPVRVELNLLNSANQIFADYQPHNGNVFSIIDTLQYQTSKDAPIQVVHTASLSYYVVGWHALPGQDPFAQVSAKDTREGCLAALNMILDNSSPVTKKGITDWLNSPDPTQLICHGAMYNVNWTATQKPSYVPADAFFERVTKDVPIAVGTTPMDALQAYIQTHTCPRNPDKAKDIKKVEADLKCIQKLLYARDDGVDAQAEATDMLENRNFGTSSGGSQYFLSAGQAKGTQAAGQPTKPSDANIGTINDVNTTQQYLDALNRQIQWLRWDMFSYWWQYLSAIKPPDSGTTNQDVLTKTALFTTFLNQLIAMENKRKSALDKLPADLGQMGTLPHFYAPRDPTLLVAGMESGWPWDYLNPLQARVDTQIQMPSPFKLPDSWSQFYQAVSPNLPQSLTAVIKSLLTEFLALNPTNPSPPTPGDGYCLPLYHDQDKAHFLPDGTAPWRDRWENSQAWFPLFLEWVAEYTHIPFVSSTETPPNVDPKVPQCWSLDQHGAWPSDPQKLRYGIKDGIELEDLTLSDSRTVSGRVLFLPQANKTLQNMVEQVLTSLPDGYLDPSEIQELNDHLSKMAFLSSPLAGFTNHLLTKVQGNHIKPTLRTVDPKTSLPAVVPFKAAIEATPLVKFQKTQLEIMGIETDLTPYGTLVTTVDTDTCPFKPATHGQFRFTALNVIDKFGQAVPAIDPKPAKGGPPPLYPCISESYSPQVSNQDSKKANTIVKDPEGLCQYVQLPPNINQPARLNTTFVDYIGGAWQPLNEWDSDFVWGWVVPNYADSGIQLFLPDGTFYREIRLGGPGKATGSGSFLPYPAPPPSTEPANQQLELFAKQLTDANYLHSFITMLTTALKTSAAPPTAYGEFLSAIVGRPLALTKVAISLELATAPNTNQSGVSIGQPPQKLTDYSFGVQLGDRFRTYDGLIAYFESLPLDSTQVGNSLQLDTLYTHFVDPDPPAPTPSLTPIASDNYPQLNPFWLDPMDKPIANDPNPDVAYRQLWNTKLKPFGAILDPFVPLHAYSGILPTGALQLPAWTWQTALQRITTFFHMGPLLATADVPGFDSKHALGPAYDLTKDDQLFPDSQIPLPAMQAGEWAWLQPYATSSNGAPSPNAAYMAFGVAAVDTRPRFEPSPYTALEGYMQLRQSVQQPAGTSAAAPASVS